MQLVRDEGKKSQKYLTQLQEQNFVVKNLAEHNNYLKSLKETRRTAEMCIEKLMSDRGANMISNR